MVDYVGWKQRKEVPVDLTLVYTAAPQQKRSND
jgi:hypothetical protein